MKKLGSGLQFNVYNLGNGKVEKIRKTDFQMYLTSLFWEPYLIFTPWVLAKNIQHAKWDREFSINYFKDNKSKLLANLEITDKRIYQSQVTPLSKIIGKDFERDKEIIDFYTTFILDCWKEGFSDKVYNFLQNKGIDNDGNIVLMDFAEISTSKEDTLRDITNKAWENAADYKFRIQRGLKKYYSKKMEEVLTSEALDRYWKKEIGSMD